MLTPKGQSPTGQDQDDVILLPISTATQKVLGANKANAKAVGSVMVQAMSPQAMDQAIQEIEALLRERHRILPGLEDDFTIRNLAEVFAAQETSAQVMSILLGAIASVSLVVGGIGIMNIMLVSVTERTREIGLRLAVGAKRRDILSQFLVEAVTLSLLGGIIGIVVGLSDVAADLAIRAMVHAGQPDVGADVVCVLGAGRRVLRLLPGAEGGVPESD